MHLMRREGLETVELDGEVSIFNPTERNALMLNGTASSIWRLLERRREVDEIVAELASDYGTDPDQIRTDVHNAVDELTRLGAVVAVD